MNFAIAPLCGAGPLKFGMTPNEVRGILGTNFQSFRKTPEAGFPCDYFSMEGVFAYYKVPGVLEAVEFADPSDPTLRGEHLVGANALGVKGMLEAINASLEIDSSGFVSHATGVGIYAPGWNDDGEQIVESVIAFEKGYYD
jgi:hypothetical protein